MTDESRLLEIIEAGLNAHGGDLDGWTKRDGGGLSIFDGRVTLRAVIHDADSPSENIVHAHVLAALHDYDDEELDACVMGLGESREDALSESGMIWITCVAGPIRSFLDNKPVCMTCQAGVENGDTSQGFSEGDYGLPGLRAYVGPAFSRMIDTDGFAAAMSDKMPWFRYSIESAAPNKVHMAKCVLQSEGKQGWHRQLEIDGHAVSHHDHNWPTKLVGPDVGYVTRFAVFEFPLNSTAIAHRQELDRTIREFAAQLVGQKQRDQILADMDTDGFDPELIHEAESISSIAFGRVFFENFGFNYSPSIIRARADGRVETDVALASLPAYCRGRAIAGELRETLSEEDWQSVGFYNAESNAILQFLQQAGDNPDLSGVSFLPCVVPDRNASDETIQAAIAQMKKHSTRAAARKPWWKFW